MSNLRNVAHPGKKAGDIFFKLFMIFSFIFFLITLFTPLKYLFIEEIAHLFSNKGKARAIKSFDQKLKNAGLTRELLDLQILIRKRNKELLLLHEDTIIATYPVALGKDPVGIKLNGKDNKTPEGQYHICYKDPDARYHLFLQLNYPSPDDAKRGAVQQLVMPSEEQAIIKAWEDNTVPPTNTKMGGPIGIQGFGTESNWTHGSIAMHNIHIEELFWNIATGTPVAIVP